MGAPVTVLVEVSITETVVPLRLGTYTRVPVGLIAMAKGSPPVTMGDPTTVFVAMSITETVPSAELAM